MDCFLLATVPSMSEMESSLNSIRQHIFGSRKRSKESCTLSRHGLQGGLISRYASEQHGLSMYTYRSQTEVGLEKKAST